jgi:hypothetical protein
MVLIIISIAQVRRTPDTGLSHIEVTADDRGHSGVQSSVDGTAIIGRADIYPAQQSQVGKHQHIDVLHVACLDADRCFAGSRWWRIRHDAQHHSLHSRRLTLRSGAFPLVLGDPGRFTGAARHPPRTSFVSNAGIFASGRPATIFSSSSMGSSSRTRSASVSSIDANRQWSSARLSGRPSLSQMRYALFRMACFQSRSFSGIPLFYRGTARTREDAASSAGATIVERRMTT